MIRWVTAENPNAVSTTQVQKPAILAWEIFDDEVDIRSIRVPDEGKLHMGVRVFDNEDGTWRYEYAIHDLNSDRSIGSFEIPLGDCVSLSNIGFHDVNYHSGEIIDGTDWTATVESNRIIWETVDYDTNEWANAIRWGSMYNFYFTADQPPSQIELTLGLFKPGAEPTVGHIAAAPACQVPCAGDVNGSGGVGIEDLLVVVDAWGTANPDADITGDGVVDVADILAVMSDWGCGG